MFEQAVLPSRPAGGRYWSVAAGFTAELFAVALLLLAPLIWTDFLPRMQALTWISLPSPPPPIVKEPPPAHVQPAHTQIIGRTLLQPITIPSTPLTIEDPPPAEKNAAVESGVRGAPANAFLNLLDLVRPAPPEHHVAQPAVSQPVKSAPAEPRRISALHPARLVHRVEPIYPALARAARISGTVELTGVIATDGRIRELRVMTGHPFLAQAALDAVRQWIYEPTVLNGEPVEVTAPITVRFNLN
jgi:periplasmic protein TonB